MQDIRPGDDETLEDLQLAGLKLLQKKSGFRYGMDSVLLAHFAAIRPDDTVADFGTGSAVLPLLLYGRGKGSRFVGLEIQPEYCEMAKRTVRLNHLEEKITICCADAGKADTMFDACSVDAVICNPPYGKPGASLISPYYDKAVARSQQGSLLKSFFTSAFRILKGKGKISIVYPAPLMLQAMNQMSACHLEPKRFQLIYPYQNKAANLVLIEGIKDAKPTLQPMKPLIVFRENQDLTNELKSIYHMDEQNTV